MNGRENAAMAKNEETKEEIIGVLTAISIVSRRLAKRLAVFECIHVERRDESDWDKTASP